MAAYITASRLRDGVAVWRGSDQAWATDIAEAALFDGDALEATLALAEAEEAQHIVLDVHPAPAAVGEDIRPDPATFADWADGSKDASSSLSAWRSSARETSSRAGRRAPAPGSASWSAWVLGAGGVSLNGETQKAIMGAVPRHRARMASGINTTARFSGILLGFAGLSAVLAVRAREKLIVEFRATFQDHGLKATEFASHAIVGDAAGAATVLGRPRPPTMPRRVSTWPTGVTRKGFLARSSRPRRSLRARACW
jgi:hypothetical protein